MQGHAAGSHSFWLPKPQVLFHRASPCQDPRRPSLYQGFFPSWRTWQLSLLSSCGPIPPACLSSFQPVYHLPNLLHLLHFQSVKCSRASPPSVQLGFSLSSLLGLCHLPTCYVVCSLSHISLMWWSDSSTSVWLLHVRTQSPTMPACRLGCGWSHPLSGTLRGPRPLLRQRQLLQIGLGTAPYGCYQCHVVFSYQPPYTHPAAQIAVLGAVVRAWQLCGSSPSTSWMAAWHS